MVFEKAIAYLDSCDKAQSQRLHQMKSGYSMDYTLIVAANCFQPLVFPFLVLIMAYLFPMCDLELKEQKLEELEPLEQVAYWASFGATHYLINVLVLLGVTTVMKKFFARPRPTQPEDVDGKPAPNKRFFDMRSRETNCSFPSGDAA